MRYMACISKKFPDTTIHYHVVDHQLGLQMDMNQFISNLVSCIKWMPFKNWLKAKLITKIEMVTTEMKQQSIHIPPEL